MSLDTNDIKVAAYYWYKSRSVPDAKWEIVRVRKDSAGSGFHVDFIDKKTFETVMKYLEIGASHCVRLSNRRRP